MSIKTKQKNPLYDVTMLLRRTIRSCIVIASRSRFVLGIESTFDDTGAAIVDCDATIHGEAIVTQTKEHVKAGGVDPRVAELLHRDNLPRVVEDVLRQAGIRYQDLDAVATATRPGNPFCLKRGLEFTKMIVEQHSLPFIPVHHMEAHLLTARMNSDVNFPFLGLLATGGHCIITMTHDLAKHQILGEAIDEPPGAVFDKVARALQVKLDGPDMHERLWNGGDVERLARGGDRSKVKLTTPLRQSPRVLDFSFSGLQSQTLRVIGQPEPGVNYADVAASFQHTMTQHILSRVHRAILMSRDKLNQESPTLVVAGGVVCNSYLRNALSRLCDITNITMVCPPLPLCVDNGVMIAWTGMEYLMRGKGISPDPYNERYEPKCRLGEKITTTTHRKVKLPKINYFN
ncbi:tRNA N6-adenosine threonylcarbamoyltransferase, mitochondrial isoform X1 [Ciona intestinalis]